MFLYLMPNNISNADFVHNFTEALEYTHEVYKVNYYAY